MAQEIPRPCSGGHLACRRGRHPAARTRTRCFENDSQRSGHSAGRDARLYGRQDGRRYVPGRWQCPNASGSQNDAAEGVDKQTEKPDSTQCWLTVIRFLMNGLVLRIWRNWQTRYFEVVVE